MYDLLVIGSGPSGQKGAFAAAKLGKKVAIIEQAPALIGGVCLHSGTVPSKTLREAILHLTGFRQRHVYAEQYRRKRGITMDALRCKLHSVIQSELDVLREQFDHNGIDVFTGHATFVDPHHVCVRNDRGESILQADRILIGCGTRPARPDHIPFDGEAVFDSDDILAIDRIPRSMVVVGAGVIGIEYAIMFAILGVDVTVVDGRHTILDFCDSEIVDYLLFAARNLNMRFRLGEKVHRIARRSDGQVAVQLESKKYVVAETALFSVGREGTADALNLEAAGLTCDHRGRLQVGSQFETVVSHIHAVGDIIGFPSLASSAMEQGRRAALHALGQSVKPLEMLPYGLFTIPEISMIGKNEQELTEQQVPYEVGLAHYHEIARGQIIGDETGLLKIIFHRETRKILGVHCIGDLATEIIHIGQAVMELGGTLDYFCDTVFNYPTMAECYRVAAFNGINRLCPELDAELAGDSSLPSSVDRETAVERSILKKANDLRANVKRITPSIPITEVPMVTMPTRS